ncbi:solute carrier family 35 member G1-like [Tachypleus tridentatus]|uniref:solute carrier family 35 member G1-like n=1 Tax=Tachypleus tridentatus TaxID=6853 RepID=UPI003FD3D063
MVNKSLKSRHVGHHEVFTEVSMNEDSLDISSIYEINSYKNNKRIFHKVPFLGVLCSLISGLCFTSRSFTAAFVTKMDPVEVLVIQNYIQLLPFVPVVIYNRSSFLGVKEERFIVYMRAVLGTITLGACYCSFRLIPMADTSTIMASNPMLVTVIACVFLREPCGMFQVFTVLMTVTGVVLISRPSFLFDVTSTAHISSGRHLQGILLALSSSLAGAITIILMRKSQKTPTSVVVCIVSFSCVALGLPYLFIWSKFTIPTCGQDSVLLVVSGLCGTCGEFLLIMSLKLEEAGIVSSVKTINIVLSFVLGVSFLGQYPSWTSIVGAFLICFSILLTALNKCRGTNKQEFISLVER